MSFFEFSRYAICKFAYLKLRLRVAGIVDDRDLREPIAIQTLSNFTGFDARISKSVKANRSYIPCIVTTGILEQLGVQLERDTGFVFKVDTIYRVASTCPFRVLSNPWMLMVSKVNSLTGKPPESGQWKKKNIGN